MTRILTYIALILLVLSFGFWQNNAQAQCQYLEPNGVTIDPDAVLLEVVGGNLLAGCDPAPNSDTPLTTHDSWIYLVQGDPNNLHVALIDQNTLEAQFSSFPVDSFAFAFADRSINTADGGLGTCFITDGGAGGGDLTFAHSLNGLDYQLIPIDTTDQYDSCAIINRCISSVSLNTCCDDIAVVVHNVTDDTIDEYRSSNGGMDWTDEGTLVPDACGPLDGCVVPNAVNNRLGGYNVLYGENTGFGGFDINLINTTTNIVRKVGEDVISAVLKESCAVETTNLTYVTLYNDFDNAVLALSADNEFGLSEGFTLVHIERFANVPGFDAPGQQGFLGMGCNRFTQGPGNPKGFIFGSTFPGGNTYNATREPLSTTNALFYVQVNPGRDPTRTTESGPVGVPQLNNALGAFSVGFDAIQIGSAAAYSNTFEYAQCIFTDPPSIPTLNQWGLISLGLILLIIGAFYLRRRKARA